MEKITPFHVCGRGQLSADAVRKGKMRNARKGDGRAGEADPSFLPARDATLDRGADMGFSARLEAEEFDATFNALDKMLAREGWEKQAKHVGYSLSDGEDAEERVLLLNEIADLLHQGGCDLAAVKDDRPALRVGLAEIHEVEKGAFP